MSVLHAEADPGEAMTALGMKRDPNAPRKPMGRKPKAKPCPSCGHGDNGGHNGRRCPVMSACRTACSSDDCCYGCQGNECGCKYDGRPQRKPMPRPTKPVKARNQQRRPSGQASAQRERTVVDRAGGRCEFIVFRLSAPYDPDRPVPTAAWERCNSIARVQAVHLARRWKSPAPLKGQPAPVYSDAATFAGCVFCHDKWDRRQPGRENVRIPEEYRLAAFLEIRLTEVKRILSNRACAPVNLAELLPAGEWTVENQYRLIALAKSERAAWRPRSRAPRS